MRYTKETSADSSPCLHLWVTSQDSYDVVSKVQNV
jgi:hypothetical protein